MSRVLWVLSVVLVVVLAMGFAAANAGERVTLSLGFFTLYQVPVALVAFCGLFAGMLLMFATGIYSDLKVRRILRERLADEARREQNWFDRNQKDLFEEGTKPDSFKGEGSPPPEPRVEAEPPAEPEEDLV
ncbi:MAG: hypothetical protein PVJ76_14010 [Gemmatimonadota bacterium]|jgi:uncharacterized integral membrane protein